MLAFSCNLSIHVPAWGTTPLTANLCNPLYFQSTFPRGERQKMSVTQRANPSFNPRSRVGNDREEFCIGFKEMLSIHVPAWGTTRCFFCHSSLFSLSIHVPAWGTTLYDQSEHHHRAFQSTFPRGERQKIQEELDRLRTLSIHVPAWGTTSQDV